MQKLTITGSELVTVVNYLYPDLRTLQDFRAVKFSDSDDTLLEWLTDKYPEPDASELENNLILAQETKAQAEAEAQAKRNSALAKLEALGLDEDDLKALGL